MAQVGWSSTQMYYTYVWVEPCQDHIGPEPLVQQVVFKGRIHFISQSLHVLDFSCIYHIFPVFCSITWRSQTEAYKHSHCDMQLSKQIIDTGGD